MSMQAFAEVDEGFVTADQQAMFNDCLPRVGGWVGPWLKTFPTHMRDDLVNEALTVIWKACQRSDVDPKRFIAYAKTCVNHHIVDMYRHYKTREFHNLLLPGHAAYDTSSPTPIVSPECALLHKEVEKLVANDELLRLRFVDGLTNAEITKKTGMSRSAVAKELAGRRINLLLELGYDADELDIPRHLIMEGKVRRLTRAWRKNHN